MTYRPNPPWSAIHDYLTEVGSEREARGLAKKAVELIDGLIPHDGPANFVIADGDYTLTICGAPGKMAEEYNEYYGARFPLRTLIKEQRVSTRIEWARHEHTEYVADFLRRYGVWHTIGTSVYRNTLAVSRSRHEPAFSDRELAIIEILSPHLHNLYSCLTVKAALDPARILAAELALDCRVLSRREAEVAALLCQRLSVPEIASRLLIGARTVESHIINIYEKLRVRNRRELLLKLLGDRTGEIK